MLRVLESLAEHTNDFLNAFLPEDPRFKIDYDILHSGLEALRQRPQGVEVGVRDLRLDLIPVLTVELWVLFLACYANVGHGSEH